MTGKLAAAWKRIAKKERFGRMEFWRCFYAAATERDEFRARAEVAEVKIRQLIEAIQDCANEGCFRAARLEENMDGEVLACRKILDLVGIDWRSMPPLQTK